MSFCHRTQKASGNQLTLSRVHTLRFSGTPWFTDGTPLDSHFPGLLHLTLHLRWLADRQSGGSVAAHCTVTPEFCNRVITLDLCDTVLLQSAESSSEMSSLRSLRLHNTRRVFELGCVSRAQRLVHLDVFWHGWFSPESFQQLLTLVTPSLVCTTQRLRLVPCNRWTLQTLHLFVCIPAQCVPTTNNDVLFLDDILQAVRQCRRVHTVQTGNVF